MGKRVTIWLWILGAMNVTFSLFILACQNSEIIGSEAENTPPDTYLSNVPPENTSATPYPYRLSFSWDGGDVDGVVVGFYYRWDENDWVYTDKRTSRFVFKSPDSTNRHVFEVKAVDNDGTHDPTPATRAFFTRRNRPPKATIEEGPEEGEEVFSLQQPTETWKGIPFRFSGTDEDGEIIGFEYAVDNTADWTFVTENAIRLAGFQEGEHTIYVRAVDDAQGRDLDPAKRSFFAIRATLNQGILIIDETRDGSGNIASPSDIQVDEFYDQIFRGNGRGYTSWDITGQGHPKVSDLASYSLIVWHADDRAEQRIRISLEKLKGFMDVGGKLWLVGWRLLPEIDGFIGSSSHTYKPNDFGAKYLKLIRYEEQTQFDFVGANGLAGYPNIDLDNGKLLASFAGRLNYVGTMTTGESEAILSFKSAEGSSFEGQPCGIKYFGSKNKIVIFSFPFYFMNETQAIDLTAKVLAEFGE